MVTRDINHLGPRGRHGHDLANDLVMEMGPVETALQFPEVDDVTDQIQAITIDVVEKIEKILILAASGTQVHIGNPDASIIQFHDRVFLSKSVTS